MSSTSTSSVVSASDKLKPLSAEVIDAITDAILSAPDPLARGRVIAEVVREICESVAWLDPEPHEELVSLRRVTREVEAHCARLASMGG